MTLHSPQGSVAVTNSGFVANSPFESSPGEGTIGIIASKLKLRSSEVSSRAAAIVITGPGVDLGTLSDPGNNTVLKREHQRDVQCDRCGERHH